MSGANLSLKAVGWSRWSRWSQLAPRCCRSLELVSTRDVAVSVDAFLCDVRVWELGRRSVV